MDKTLFRVTFICSCEGDAAFGYGPDEAEAYKNAQKFFRRNHGSNGKASRMIVEKAVPHGGGGSHYEIIKEEEWKTKRRKGLVP